MTVLQSRRIWRIALRHTSSTRIFDASRLDHISNNAYEIGRGISLGQCLAGKAAGHDETSSTESGGGDVP